MAIRGIRNKEKTVHTEKSIIKTLRNHFMSPTGAKYQIENLFVYNIWESDFLYITKSDYAYECEVKISRSDFFNDKKKVEKHQILEGTYQLKKYETEQPLKPNYFYYAVPEDLITVEEVPEYAGLIYITDMWPYVKIVKTAPKIHNEKFDEAKLKLTDKFYYNYLDWKAKAEDRFQWQIDSLKEQLNEAKTDEEGNKHKYTLKSACERIEELEKEVLPKKDKEIDYLHQMTNEYLAVRRKLRNKLMDLGLSWLEIDEIEENGR